MNTYKAYPACKDSGVEWIGKAPGHWELKPLKTVVSCNDDLLSESTPPKTTIKYIDISSVNDEKGIFRVEEMPFADAPSRARRKAKSGDVIVSTVRTCLKAIASVDAQFADCVFSTGFAVLRSRPEALEPQFLKWLVLNDLLIQAVEAHSEGLSYPAISPSALVNLKTAIPGRTEQVKIALVLDRETKRADALITRKVRFIELLKEKRQALINNAVTQGLNPGAKMKDSGIEWIGRIPEHWEIKPFKTCIDFQEGPGIMARDFRQKGIPLLRVSGVRGKWATLEGCNYLDPTKVAKQWERFRLAKEDFLISASASIGAVSEVGHEAEGAIAYTGLIRLRGNAKFMVKPYIRALVVSSVFATQIDRFKAGSTIQHFGPTHLGQMLAICPPLEEQSAIAKHIAQETQRIELLIEKTQHSIKLLKERRSALITAAVTGQIDLRESRFTGPEKATPPETSCVPKDHWPQPENPSHKPCPAKIKTRRDAQNA